MFVCSWMSFVVAMCVCVYSTSEFGTLGWLCVCVCGREGDDRQDYLGRPHSPLSPSGPLVMRCGSEIQRAVKTSYMYTQYMHSGECVCVWAGYVIPLFVMFTKSHHIYHVVQAPESNSVFVFEAIWWYDTCEQAKNLHYQVLNPTRQEERGNIINNSIILYTYMDIIDIIHLDVWQKKLRNLFFTTVFSLLVIKNNIYITFFICSLFSGPSWPWLWFEAPNFLSRHQLKRCWTHFVNKTCRKPWVI